MTPWEVIEEALARKKKKTQWLVERLRHGTTAQTVANWKSRGSVPPARFEEIADVFGLTLDQVAGRKPLPWANEGGWPFPDIEQLRYQRLTELQKGGIQQKVGEMIDEFERSGKRSGGVVTFPSRRKPACRLNGPARIYQFRSSVPIGTLT